ncbi:unnamed protein product [Tuwongella immobilis]|uniref:Repeat-companion domain protein n=2 Tax=Tuwongella immobilis TaxID=692036 RepID=A0A6C2YJF1_9BACT|nr:unnamed protein product [Tuwongella immobilis]VTR98325.1 unnamed protein product [Tuwongella immobilis]
MIPLPPETVEAILESPEDDSLRLMAADRLEEAGDAETAEFIRLQCQLARASRDGLRPTELRRLNARQDLLISRHRDRWLEPFRRIWEGGIANFAIARGVMTLLEVRAALTDDRIPLLLGIPLLERFICKTRTQLTPESLQTFAALRNLHELDIRLNVVSLEWEEIAPLAELPRLQRLELRNLAGRTLMRPHLTRWAAARARHLRSVEDDRDRHQQAQEQLRDVLQRSLAGSCSMVLKKPKRELVTAQHIPALTGLWIRDPNATHLEQMGALEGLRSLSISRLRVERLGSLPRMPQLREIRLDSRDSLDGMLLGRWLREMPNLTALAVYGTLHSAWSMLQAIEHLPNLRIIDLMYSTLNPSDLAMLRMPSLLELNLHEVAVDPTLTLLERFPRLRVLMGDFPQHGPEFATRLAEFANRGVLLTRGVDSNEIPRWMRSHGTVGCPVAAFVDGSRMPLPVGQLRLAESLDSQSPVNRLADWQEFGENDPATLEMHLAPARIQIERIELSRGLANVRGLLVGPALPVRTVRWSISTRFTTESGLQGTRMDWTSGRFAGNRLLILTRQRAYRIQLDVGISRRTTWNHWLEALAMRFIPGEE